MEEISCGEKVLVSPRYSTSTKGLPPWSTTLKGQDSMSFLTTGSSNLRPIRRLEGPLGHPTHDTGNPTSFNLLDIEDSVLRVHSSLVLGGLTDQTLLVGERDERRGGVATLLVRNCAQKKNSSEPKTRVSGVLCIERLTDFDIGTLIVGNTGVGGTCGEQELVCCHTGVGPVKIASLTKVDANGTLVNFVRHLYSMVHKGRYPSTMKRYFGKGGGKGGEKKRLIRSWLRRKLDQLYREKSMPTLEIFFFGSGRGLGCKKMQAHGSLGKCWS